jgi:hypothetical protein
VGVEENVNKEKKYALFRTLVSELPEILKFRLNYNYTTVTLSELPYEKATVRLLEHSAVIQL